MSLGNFGSLVGTAGFGSLAQTGDFVVAKPRPQQVAEQDRVASTDEEPAQKQP